MVTERRSGDRGVSKLQQDNRNDL